MISTCAACGSSDALARVRRDGFIPVLLCRDCGVRSLDADTLVLTDDTVEQTYDEYIRSYSGHIERAFARRLKLLEDVAPAAARVLDVGCSYGIHFDGLRSAGYRVSALEISPLAVSHLRASGTEVFTGFEAVPTSSFDVVTMWHALEHMPDPLQALREVNRVLKPGGTLLLAVPNASGFFSKVAFDHWVWTLPWHRHYFTAAGLRVLARRAGLTQRWVKTEIGDVAALESALGGMLHLADSGLRIPERREAEPAASAPERLAWARRAARPVSLAIQVAARSVGLGEELDIRADK
jgi:SAM-dependent methyltransferase